MDGHQVNLRLRNRHSLIGRPTPPCDTYHAMEGLESSSPQSREKCTNEKPRRAEEALFQYYLWPATMCEPDPGRRRFSRDWWKRSSASAMKYRERLSELRRQVLWRDSGSLHLKLSRSHDAVAFLSSFSLLFSIRGYSYSLCLAADACLVSPAHIIS